MEPYLFDRKTAPWNPIYDGTVDVQWLVTRKGAGSRRIGLHVSAGKPAASGRDELNRDLDEIIFVLEGSIGVDCGDGMQYLAPDQGILIPAGTRYDWAAGPAGWTAVIVFSPPEV